MAFSKEQALKYLQVAIGRGDAQFKDGQWEAIDALVHDRKRCLVIQSTGWGKSMVYFTSTKLLREQGYGPTIIVSPLLALMRNQVEAAGRLGLRAVTLNSTNMDQFAGIKAELLADQIDLILLSPEKLSNDAFVAEYIVPIANKVGLLVVDEAHCISDWGHDFRPDYKRIVRILKRLPAGIPVLATTATANDRVVGDILAQLGAGTQISRGPLARSSLSLDTVQLDDPASRLAWVTKKIKSFAGSGIVYVLTQRDAERVADWLVKAGIKAEPYHGGMKEEREDLETGLINNKIKCLVATSALGMGFDKPDLEFVIHFQAPSSIVDYYQQVGRAGRGIDQAHGILIFGEEDAQVNQFFRTAAFPPRRRMERVLELLEESLMGLTKKELGQALNIRDSHLDAVLKYLSVQEPAPVIKAGNRWTRTPNPFVPDDAQITRITRIREAEWGEIVEYGKKQKCLMLFLGEKLDDPHAQPCGKCSVCTKTDATADDIDPNTYAAAQRFLSHSEIPIEPRKLFSDSGLGQQFGAPNSRIPEDRRAEVGRSLSRYGEPVIGKLVQQCKKEGSFNRELVAAAAKMIQERWPEAESLEWVTCIPSNRHPELVSGFAARLAKELGLPYHPALTKVQETKPQKEMENSYHQCKNLLQAFEANVPGKLQNKDVLLIDDMVDSRWTLTIAAFLLRNGGAGQVFPLALASSAPGS